MFFPEMILVSMTWFASLVTINLVPLHIPSDWSRFLSNIIEVPIFNLMLWLGIPNVFNVFRNSGVIVSSGVVSTTSECQLSHN